MRWPFVSRITYDTALARWRDQGDVAAGYATMADARLARAESLADQLRADLSSERERYHALVLATQPKPVATLPARTIDPVYEAITARAGSNGQLRAMLGSFARDERKKGTNDEEIEHRILFWSPSSDEEGVPSG